MSLTPAQKSDTVTPMTEDGTLIKPPELQALHDLDYKIKLHRWHIEDLQDDLAKLEATRPAVLAAAQAAVRARLGAERNAR